MYKFLFIFLIFSAFSYCQEEQKQKILFIINPISHELKNVDVKKAIEENLDFNQFEYKIAFTEYPKHASKIAEEAKKSFDIIAAVGGDGTVNEIGTALINTSTQLAIIPVGSGNGLARHFGIPIGFAQAIRALNHSRPVVIDTAKINDKAFLGVAGIGFDAHIAQQFSQFGKRGFFSYCLVALREFTKYDPETYQIKIDGKNITKKAFILSFANSSQYGNNFIVAPKADMQDGYLDLVIIDEMPFYAIPKMVYQFKDGSLGKSNHFETQKFKEIVIEKSVIQAHVDGEPVVFHNQIKITVLPKSLILLVADSNARRFAF